MLKLIRLMEKSMEIILASNSPRRKDLLTKAGICFRVISPEFEENIEDDNFDYEIIENLAYCKANSIINKIEKPACIIGADTVVILEGKILGKPQDKTDALRMLNLLNNKTHSVVTSICVIHKDALKNEIRTKSTTTEVSFSDLTQQQLEDYINTYNPLDKAGAYGIQELPDYFVKNIKGDIDNVIGLPCKTLLELLN